MKITLGSLATLSLAAGQCAFPDQRNIECATIISNDHSYYDQPYCVHTPDSTLPSGHKILCVVTTGVGVVAGRGGAEGRKAEGRAEIVRFGDGHAQCFAFFFCGACIVAVGIAGGGGVIVRVGNSLTKILQVVGMSALRAAMGHS